MFDAHPLPVRGAPPYPFGAHRLWCGVRIECLCTWGDFVAYFVATLQKDRTNGTRHPPNKLIDERGELCYHVRPFGDMAS